MSDWVTEELGFLVRIAAQQIVPAAFPSTRLSTIMEPSGIRRYWGSGLCRRRSLYRELVGYRLEQPAILVSKLNPRKMRVQSFQSAGNRKGGRFGALQFSKGDYVPPLTPLIG